MRINIYNSIADALKQLTDESGKQLIKHIDLWNQNVEFYAEFIFPTPAVFLEFAEIKYKTTKGASFTTAEIPFSLHIVTIANNNTAADGYNQEQGLDFLSLIETVNKAVLPLSGKKFGNIVRTLSLTNHDHGELMENIERYVCNGAVEL